MGWVTTEMVENVLGSTDRVFENVLNTHHPVVYIFHEGPKVWYVGISGCGLSRPFQSKKHKAARWLREHGINYSISVWYCNSKKEARDYESQIKEMNPPLNTCSGVCKWCGSTLKNGKGGPCSCTVDPVPLIPKRVNLGGGRFTLGNSPDK
jgi:predicted GIY-YIG superfamily endonuclease